MPLFALSPPFSPVLTRFCHVNCSTWNISPFQTYNLISSPPQNDPIRTNALPGPASRYWIGYAPAPTRPRCPLSPRSPRHRLNARPSALCPPPFVIPRSPSPRHRLNVRLFERHLLSGGVPATLALAARNHYEHTDSFRLSPGSLRTRSFLCFCGRLPAVARRSAQRRCRRNRPSETVAQGRTEAALEANDIVFRLFHPLHCGDRLFSGNEGMANEYVQGVTAKTAAGLANPPPQSRNPNTTPFRLPLESHPRGHV